ncbi:hypothetical protein BC936DRAFT_136793 [Jimgerdemannia flammicorona]|uniref:Uncharacterized protein n=1 Tax=Jimgerdemannia flammicorona TaxID=994334 RepID=A0A433CYV5_9FUNG|nr:hypothetical protein BC936DRAFT_136793 [Jimgerdemannia flammicorona]
MKNLFRKSRSKDDHAYVETGEYTHLVTTNVPFELDYIQTFFTLCDILCEVYHKLLMNTNGGVCTQPFCELVLKIDGRFKISDTTLISPLALVRFHTSQLTTTIENHLPHYQGAGRAGAECYPGGTRDNRPTGVDEDRGT